jgi:hypothetical protein
VTKDAGLNGSGKGILRFFERAEAKEFRSQNQYLLLVSPFSLFSRERIVFDCWGSGMPGKMVNVSPLDRDTLLGLIAEGSYLKLPNSGAERTAMVFRNRVGMFKNRTHSIQEK